MPARGHLPDFVHKPRRTVRLRLTLLYGGLFLISGATLLAITYLLFSHSTTPVFVLHRTEIGRPANGAEPPTTLPNPRRLREQSEKQHDSEMHQLLVQSVTALAIMALISIVLGWFIAGRVLRPLRTMTAATRRISEANLHERLALAGPSDELKDLADTIDELLARLEAAFDAQRRFVANASHELRTPLAMIRTSLDVATAKSRDRELLALDRKLREGLDQADRLLESFLLLARAQHTGSIEAEPVPLSSALSEALRAHADAIAEKGIDVRRSIVDVRVAGSRVLVERMVENLVDNAVRHNQPGGWLRAVCERDGTIGRVIVESGGERLDEERVRKLVQPFGRLGAERTGSNGSVGLGLSIVAAIAAAHDGTVDLQARSEGGLKVSVELPLEPASVAGVKE